MNMVKFKDNFPVYKVEKLINLRDVNICACNIFLSYVQSDWLGFKIEFSIGYKKTIPFK